MSDDIEVLGPTSVISDEGTQWLWHVSDLQHTGIVVRASEPAMSAPLVRIQSSCVFSESLGAIDCDCASQLAHARRLIIAEGGLLLYLFEEGRGAGLRAKFQAHMLQQEEGLGTGIAYDRLGMPRDPRNYDFAASVLKHFIGQDSIRLLTNNPSRKEGLVEAGIPVLESVPLIVRRDETQAYLADKANSLGHEV